MTEDPAVEDRREGEELGSWRRPSRHFFPL